MIHLFAASVTVYRNSGVCHAGGFVDGFFTACFLAWSLWILWPRKSKTEVAKPDEHITIR
jgi:hypothetical protein